jgi:hypothetical protein
VQWLNDGIKDTGSSYISSPLSLDWWLFILDHEMTASATGLILMLLNTGIWRLQQCLFYYKSIIFTKICRRFQFLSTFSELVIVYVMLLKFDLWSGCIGLTWELVTAIDSQALPRSWWIRICILARFRWFKCPLTFEKHWYLPYWQN